MYLKLIALFTSLSWLFFNCYAQTSGIGNVISVESMAKKIESNKEAIIKAKNDLIQLEDAQNSKLQKLRDEIAALYKERDNIISDMKVGARCSQCNKWKSEFEKNGESFQKHLGDVNGYAVPATTSELEDTRKKFTERIALKKVQLQNMEKADNDISRKKAEIQKLEKENETLCTDITSESKRYETNVFSEAKNKHNNWLETLMDNASYILIADDRITIAKSIIAGLKKEFEFIAEKTRAQLKKDMEEEQEKLRAKIAVNDQKRQTTLDEQKEYLSPLEIELTETKRKKSTTELSLKTAGINQMEKDSITAVLQELNKKINELGKTIQQYNETVKTKLSLIESDNLQLQEDISALSFNLSKLQAQEVAKIKVNYDAKITASNDLANRATITLATARKDYTAKANMYNKDNSSYIDEVVSESNRMLVAAQRVKCTVWNEVRGMVATNWNKLFPCVNNITTLAKPYSSSVFNAYCPSTSAGSYLRAYRAFLSGLNAEEKSAVKDNSNADWFNLLTK